MSAIFTAQIRLRFEDSYKPVISLYLKISVPESNKISAGEVERNAATYDLFSTTKHAKFPKSNVERWTDVRTIFLSNDHNVDGSSKSGGVYLAVKSPHVRYKTA